MVIVRLLFVFQQPDNDPMSLLQYKLLDKKQRIVAFFSAQNLEGTPTCSRPSSVAKYSVRCAPARDSALCREMKISLPKNGEVYTVLVCYYKGLRLCQDKI